MKKEDAYQLINYFANKIGLGVRRFPAREQRRLIKYLTEKNINYCFDVGANVGQFGRNLRSIGYKGQILSFEPQKNAFRKLEKYIKHDPFWDAINIGLGNTDGAAKINVSKNSVSSSMLNILDTHINASPESQFINVEDIEVHRLDSFISERGILENYFLKIDAQGFESKILEGAVGCMHQISALQLELACVPLYAGELLFDDMKKRIESEGFYLSSIESGFADENDGRLLQVEAIFLRK
jgi:FkbM family methyltransferase